MSDLKSKNFQDAIKPLIYLNCFVGVNTFRLRNQSNFSYICMQLYVVIITIISWTAIYIYLIFYKRMIEYENTAHTSCTIHEVVAFITSCFTGIAPLLVWLRNEELKNCLRKMSILDNAFQVPCGLSNGYRKQYTLLIRRVIAIIILSIIASTFDAVSILELAFQNKIIFGFGLYAMHHQLIVMLVLDLNFCTFVGYLEQKFRDMNNTILGITDKPSTSCRGKRPLDAALQNVMGITLGNRVENTESDELINEKYCLLREARKVHLELCKLARKINCAFGIQNLISMGISFITMTGMLYNIYSSFLWDHLKNLMFAEVMATATWATIYALRILVVNYSCWSVSTEAEKTGEAIYELLNTKIERKFQQEIREFGIQMLQNPVRFNACGFFPLDHTFVQGVIGSVTTYLIILIQMSPEFEGLTFDTSHAGNDTKVLVN